MRDAEATAHCLTQADGEAIAAIRAAFGNDYLMDDGALDRAKLRPLTFSDPGAMFRKQRGNGPLAAADPAGESDNKPPVLITSDLAVVL